MGLLEIAKLPTAENAVIHLHPPTMSPSRAWRFPPGASCRWTARPSPWTTYSGRSQDRSRGRSSAGEHSCRYGQMIGRARRRIEPGRHVHTHNVAFEELLFDYEFPAARLPLRGAAGTIPDLSRISARRRRVGTRNYIAVVAASNCAAHTAELIARQLRRRNAAAQHRWRGRRFRTAKAAATPSAPTPSSCSARWPAS